MIIEHPFQKTIEETLARDDLVVLPKLRTVAYFTAKSHSNISIGRYLLSFVAPKKPGVYTVSELNALLHSFKPNSTPEYTNFYSQTKYPLYNLHLGLVKVLEMIDIPLEFEYSDDELLVTRDGTPYRSFSGEKYTPDEKFKDKLFYQANIFLYPNEEFAQKSLEQAKVSYPPEWILLEDFKAAQRKYKPSFWQKLF